MSPDDVVENPNAPTDPLGMLEDQAAFCIDSSRATVGALARPWAILAARVSAPEAAIPTKPTAITSRITGESQASRTPHTSRVVPHGSHLAGSLTSGIKPMISTSELGADPF